MTISMQTIKTLVIVVLTVAVVWLGIKVWFPGQPPGSVQSSRNDQNTLNQMGSGMMQNNGQSNMNQMGSGMMQDHGQYHMNPPTAGSNSELNDGETIFKTKCAMCHGQDGHGKTAIGKGLGIPDLHSPVVQKQSDDQLFRLIAGGKEPMPAFEKSLDDAQIHQVIAYLRQLRNKS